MADRSILVLGGTGKTGRRVVTRLRQRGRTVRAASRAGQTRFDWGDESTWAPALEGVEAAYLIDSQGADAAVTLGSFSALAVTGGVERLVLLSARDWAVSGGEEMLGVERAVQDSGGQWTVLRPTWFVQNFGEEPFLRDPIVRGEVVLSAGDGLEPFIDAEDIADVAVAALTEEGHAGQTYELSGPRLLTFGAAVEEIARATGRDIRYRPVSAAEYAAHAAQSAVPAEFADVVNMLFGWIRAGRNSHLSDGVQRALGREPRDVSGYFAATAATAVWHG